MKVVLKSTENLRITGYNSKMQETFFDSVPDYGGEGTAPTPMEIILQALGACSMLDVLTILKKKRKKVTELAVQIEGTRAEDHPKVFTKAHIIFELTSPDAVLQDLERAVELSETKYCSVSGMFQRSGCEVTYQCRLKE